MVAKKDLLSGGSNKRYVNLAHVIRLRIRTGEYAPGSRLPSIEQIASQFDAAVVTTRQALGLLEADGLVQRRQGVGTFVSDSVVAPAALQLPLDEDWSGIRNLWQNSTTRILGEHRNAVVPIDHGQPGTLGDAYHHMRRLHEAQGMPYTVADIYLDQSIFEKAPKRFRKEIVLHLLRKLMPDTKLDAHETIQIDAADVELAKLLDIAVGAPVVIMKRVVRDQAGRILYVGIPIYRGDIVRLDRTFAI